MANAANDNIPRTRAEAKSQGLITYLSSTSCKNGHIGERYTSNQGCVECYRLRHVEKMDTPGYRDNRNSKQRERYAEDEDFREALRKQNSDRRSTTEYWDRENERRRSKRANDPEHREKLNAYQREYNSRPEVKSKKKIKDAERYLKKKNESKDDVWRRRDYHREYMREKLASDPQFRLNQSFSSAVRRSLASGKGGRNWPSLVGYTVDDLREHIEKLFLPGMTWENYGDWHIDHKIPLSAHNFETPDDIDFKRAWGLSNLQPMWAADNIRKGAKLDKPFQPSLLLRPANDNKPQN